MTQAGQDMYPNCVDTGPVERWRHADRLLVCAHKDGPISAKVADEHLLDRLSDEGWLTEAEKAAGLRLQGAFLSAGLDAHLCSSYSPVRSGPFSVYASHDERNEAEEKAYRAWRAAISAMGAHASAALSVACYQEIPSPSAALRAKQALKNLALWYAKKDTRTRAN